MSTPTKNYPFSEIPKVDLAVITGSPNWGIRFPEDVGMLGVSVIERDINYETEYGLSENWKLIEFDASITPDGVSRRALCLYSHANPREVMDHSCHRRAFVVLQEAGVRHIVSSSSLGAFNKAIDVGDLVINADIIELTQTPYSLLPGRTRFDANGKQLICPVCAGILADVAKKYWPTEFRIHKIEAGRSGGRPRLWTAPDVAGRGQCLQNARSGRVQPLPRSGSDARPRDWRLLRALRLRHRWLQRLFPRSVGELPARRRARRPVADCFARCSGNGRAIAARRRLPLPAVEGAAAGAPLFRVVIEAG